MTSPVLVIDGVVKSYRRGSNEVQAVRDVGFELTAGTMTALVGPSGSGKTTLMNIVLGWETADAGSVSIGLGDGPAGERWDELAVVPQSLGLLDEVSIEENVLLPARLGAALVEATEVIEALGLGSLRDRLPRETSLGEQQRTAVARAVVARPRLLVADEPTSHQDEASTDRVIAALRACCDSGGTVLVATHDERVVGACDRVLAISDGEVSGGGAPEAERAEPNG